jgi:ribosomal protein S18 acetylase RimI-like enzyme
MSSHPEELHPTAGQEASFCGEKMYRLQQGDLSKASTILSQSFNSYPIFEYVIPNPVYGRDHLRYLCRFLLGLGMSRGEVIAPSNKIEGVSIWLPSDGSDVSGMDAIRAGLLGLVFRVDTKTLGRFLELGNIKGKMRERIVQGPYYSCDMIGVDPRFQRLGYGRKMIEAKLGDFDEAKMPCYLETSELRNIAYYERFGFALIHEYPISDVTVFCLLREPNAAKAA